MIDKTFCAAVVTATARIKKEREEKDSCPIEMAGCGRRGALYSVSQRGITCGKFCGFCGWSTLFLEAKDTSRRRSEPKGSTKRSASSKVVRKQRGAES